MLPTFIVIGAMKCGTTSLYYQLDAHPDVAMSILKETNYFISKCDFEKGRYEEGRDWYESRFREVAKARGECSPNYTKAHLFPGVAQRMHDLVPDIQLIYMVRDPVERLISHYVQNCVQGLEDQSFAGAVTEPVENKYVLTSRYFWQLQPYLEVFDEEQILIRSLESLRDRPLEILRDIHSFIGIESHVVEAQLQRGHFNPTSEKRIRGEWYRWFSGVVSQPIKDALRPYVPIHWIPGTQIDRPTPSESIQQKLTEALEEDVKSLRQFTGRVFEEWSV